MRIYTPIVALPVEVDSPAVVHIEGGYHYKHAKFVSKGIRPVHSSDSDRPQLFYSYFRSMSSRHAFPLVLTVSTEAGVERQFERVDGNNGNPFGYRSLRTGRLLLVEEVGSGYPTIYYRRHGDSITLTTESEGAAPYCEVKGPILRINLAEVEYRTPISNAPTADDLP